MGVLYPVFIALVFNGVDLLTGILGAIKNKELQSSKLRDGVFKKVGFIVCYCLALLIDIYGSQVGLNLGIAILPIVVAYVIFTECISIIENISVINPDLLPDKLMSLFHLTDNKKETHNETALDSVQSDDEHSSKDI